MFSPTAKILVVDDMKSMRRVVCNALGDLGYRTTVEAEDGLKAWACLEEAFKAGQPFDLVISDWDMPKLKGIDLLRKLRADGRFKNLAFLMVTAEINDSSIAQATAPDTRASGFLSKPFGTEELQAQLKQAFDAQSRKAA